LDPRSFQPLFPDLDVKIDGETYLMPELIDLVLHSSEQNPAPYLRSKKLYMFFPSSWPRLSPLPYFPNWRDGGGKFPCMHFDGAHAQAFICQLYGTKKFYTYPANQTPYLYVNERYNVSAFQTSDHPEFEKFPLLAKATQNELYSPAWRDPLFASRTPAHHQRALTLHLSRHRQLVQLHRRRSGPRPLVRQPPAAYMFAMDKFRLAL
jgi:hypothetical protein